jgi:glycine/D-amino acid oxidase-like deaminating enzyme/nitrite reductase/ring-hydroxylating ferredoxin subunit
MQQIRENVCELDIKCDYHTVPVFIHTPLNDKRRNETKTFQHEAQLANELGFDAEYTASVPGMGREGVMFPNQAIFHPMKYLAGLAKAVNGGGSRIFERSEAVEIIDKPLAVRVKGSGLRISCDYVIIATHVPLMGKTGLVSATLFQTKIFPYSTYAIGASLPSGRLQQASYFDTSDPYYYLRVERRKRDDYAILGGEDHKTGQKTNPHACFASLRRLMKSIAPDAKIDLQWSGQVIETADGLPFMGESAERQFVATGYAGNGITFGTLAGMMAADAALGHRNPWQELFDVHRKHVRSGAWNYLKQNLDYPYYMIKDRLAKTEGKSTRAVERGEGMILRLHGQRTAVYRDEDGSVIKRSPVCTHMGCLVNWNAAEKTWDCPCHGSRFHPEGKVLAGPAEAPLPSA